MKCSYCGTNLPEDGDLCPKCGKKRGVDPQLVEAAKRGDQRAIAQLYNQTYNSLYHTVKSMIRDEDTVMDVMQDTYIAAFTKLEQLRDPARFETWTKRIAVNTAKNHLKRKKPVLFSELENDAGEMAVDFVDEREENLPDVVMDLQETTRLVHEILDTLPEEQRMAVAMFYYEGLSLREIADILDCPENTVKSRLNYAKKKIEIQVRELEKRGTKLYSLAPVPFLLLLLKSYGQGAPQAPSAAVLQSVQAVAAESTASGSGASGAGAAGKAAGGAAGKALLTKIIAGAAVLAVVGGGLALALPALTNRQAEPDHEHTWLEATCTEPERCAGCGETRGEPLGHVPGEPDGRQAVVCQVCGQVLVEPVAGLSPIDEALAQYRAILDRADSYEYGTFAAPTGNYRYALVQLGRGDPVPTLLLEQETETLYFARVFQYDPDAGTVIEPTDTLTEGVALAGGYRGGFDLAGDGDGLLTAEISGGTGRMYIYRTTLVNGSLQTVTAWEGMFDDPQPDGLSSVEIQWHDLGDRSALDSWEEPVFSEEAPALPAGSDAALPTDGDRIILSGTAGLFDYYQVVELQGAPDDNAEWADKSETFLLIVLDEPQSLELSTVDGYRNDTARMIRISSAAELEPYIGQHVIFSIDPETTRWPSDTSLPIGQPRTSDIHVLG